MRERDEQRAEPSALRPLHWDVQRRRGENQPRSGALGEEGSGKQKKKKILFAAFLKVLLWQRPSEGEALAARMQAAAAFPESSLLLVSDWSSQAEEEEDDVSQRNAAGWS